MPSRPASQAKAWRDLSVAFCQYVIVEQVCQGGSNGGQPVKWAFPHTVEEVDAIGKGEDRRGRWRARAVGRAGARPCRP